MSYTQYHPDTDNTSANIDKSRQDGEARANNMLASRSAAHTASGDNFISPDKNPSPLQTVADGILSGVSPLQFMDSINAGNQQLGNRAFLQFVGKLHAKRQHIDTHGIAAKGLQGPGQPLTHLDTLQQAFGHYDISGMREHTGPETEAALDTLGAEGYASGGRMAFADTPDLYTQAHEAAHGVQQAALGSGLQLKGGIGEAGDQYERHANAVAEAVVRGESAQPLLDQLATGSTQVTTSSVPAGMPVQMADQPPKDKKELKQPPPTNEPMTSPEAAPQDASKKQKKQKKQKQKAPEASVGPPQVSSELITEVERLVRETHPEQLKAVEGNYRELAEFGYSPYNAVLKANDQLLKNFKTAYNKQPEWEGECPDDFVDNLIRDFKAITIRPAESKKEKGGAKAPKKQKGTQKAKTLDQMPGLQDMFLARAINHLIKGELHKLDPMVGDEGCQLRTPFTLDMYELVQDQLKKSPYKSDASDLISKYREVADTEQATAIARMKDIEKMRTNKDSGYEGAVSKFIGSNALEASMAAKSGLYEEMFTYLMRAIEGSWPGATEYLEHLDSETVFWGRGIDPFGLSMFTFKDPIFPDAILTKRKLILAEYSKNYFVKALSDLLQVKGINTEAKQVVAGYSKKGAEERLFNVPTSNPESILSMLLYSIQLCTASIPVKHKDLPLIQAWESIRSLIPMMLAKERPVIVNLRRVIATGSEEEPKYTSDFCESLFYEPTASGYKYQPDPSPDQEEQGGFVILGFSMLRPGDEKLKEGGLNIAPWVFEEDPKKFKEGFTSVDFPNLFFLGGIKHPPLNVGAAGAKALALSPEESAQATNSTKTRDFGRNAENSFSYTEDLHTKVLENLGQTGMTKAGQKLLTPDYKLTDEAKSLIFPDQCPIDITGSRPESRMNITEEFQLLLRLAEAASLHSVLYSMQSKDYPGEVLRVANKTIPFSIKHIYSSTFKHENIISKRYAESSKGVKAGRRHKISDLDRHEH